MFLAVRCAAVITAGLPQSAVADFAIDQTTASTSCARQGRRGPREGEKTVASCCALGETRLEAHQAPNQGVRVASACRRDLRGATVWHRRCRARSPYATDVAQLVAPT